MKQILIVFFATISIANANIQVSVSVIPQAFFIKQIAGDLVDVNIMVDTGKNPETYEPSIKQLKNLSNSVAYFCIGMPFERAWIERFKNVNPNMQIIAPLKENALEQYEIELNKNKHLDKNHEHTAHHTHAPHIWLSFILSKQHITQIAETLMALDSANAMTYKTNLEAFLYEIDKLYTEAKILFHDNNKSFLVYHPAWGYIADELGLEEFAIEKDGKEMKISHTKEILSLIKQHNIKTIFLQPQFAQKNAITIANEAGIKTLIADPLAYDWLNNLHTFLQYIAEQ